MTPQRSLSRRQFMRITALAGALAASGGLLAAARLRTDVQRVHETRLLMGSITNITLFTDDPLRAQSALQAAFERMTALEGIFSRFQSSSHLSRLNAVGQLSPLASELHEVLRRALAFSALTDGAFDVTVEPVLRLYRASSRSGCLPSDDEIAQASALVDYRCVRLSEDAVHFEQPNMAVTLDGIAKGYIIDQGTQTLRERGMEQVLVEFGGDLCASGGQVDPWRIGIQSPRPGITMPIVALDQVAMATSGDYQNVFSADHRLHHILDPHSGYSPTELASATVIASSACDADALATALMVMGTRGLPRLQQMPNVSALTIDKQGTFRQTADFPLLA